MNASNKITLTIIAIYAAVLSVLILALFNQAQTDLEKEHQAALQMALRLGESALPADKLESIIHSSRNLSFRQDDNTSGSESFIYQILMPYLTSSSKSVTIHDATGQPLRVFMNNHAEIEEISATVVNVFFIFLLALLLTLFTLRYAVQTRLKPLNELCSGLDSLKEGQYELSTASTDIAEIHKLIEHYNTLIGSLEIKESQVGKLRKRLSALQENERRLLARELHDNLGQLITGITVQTYMLTQQKNNPDYIAKACSYIQQQCDAVHQGMKELTKQLYPVFLSKLGLLQSLKQLTQSWQDIHQVDVSWSEHQSQLNNNLVRDTQIYRFAQEALNNIAKHANATQVSVLFSVSDHSLFLEIKDNGSGFRPLDNQTDGLADGLGLESMHERANLLGGTFQLQTNRSGTTVTLSVPIETETELNDEYSDC